MGLRFWLLLLPLVVDPVPGSTDSGEGDSTEVIGVLGESATFQLETSEPFTLITWLKKEAKGDISNVVIINPEKPCKLTVLLPAFEGRLNASGDCRRLEVQDLRRGDSGRYMGQIQRGGGKEPLTKTFELKVYKRLSEADLAVRCHKTRNGTRELNCSTGEDDATVSWAEAIKTEPWATFALLPLSVNEEDLNATCRAKNPIGEASRMVSAKEICDAVDPSARSTTAPALNNESSPLIGVATAMLIVAKVMVSAGVFAKWPCCPRRTTEIGRHTSTSEECGSEERKTNTILAAASSSSSSQVNPLSLQK